MPDIDETLPERIDKDVIPRWVTETYPDMEKDIENWYMSYYFYRMWDKKIGSLTTTKLMARAKAQARYKSMEQTNHLKEAIDSSLWLQYYNAKRSGWFNLVEEIEDVKDLMSHILEDKINENPDSTSISDLTFILESIIPQLENMDIPKELILCVPKNQTKVKWAVPTFRKLLANPDKNTDKKIIELMKSVSDKSISADEFKQNIIPRIMKEDKPKTPPPVTALVAMLPDGRELIIIPSDPAHTRAIEFSTKNIVSGYRYTDPGYLLTQVGALVKPKISSRRKYIANEFKKLVVSHKEGVYFPALESFKDLVVSEYLKHRYYLRREGKQNLIIEEVSFSYNLSVFAASLGYKSDEEAFQAVIDLYKPVLHDLSTILPAEDAVTWELKVGYLNGVSTGGAYYIYLELEFGNVK